tara:strand:- start:1026 stop:2390 length:1365 start_codon:yes stop_codon:yes gene_type:complete
MTEKKTATQRILELFGDSMKKGESYSLDNDQVTELFDEIGFEILTPTYTTYGEEYIKELSDEHENLEAFKRHILTSFIGLVHKESFNELGIFTGEAKDIEFIFTKKSDLAVSDETKIEMRSFTLPSGEYFFGDPSYVTLDEDGSDEILYAKRETISNYKDNKYLVISTDGDGTFFNHRAKKGEHVVRVESGSLGLIPINVLDEELLSQVLVLRNAGFIINSESEVKIDLQLKGSQITGLHIYQNKSEYQLQDHAILLMFNEDNFNESDFLASCPKFAPGQNREVLILERKVMFFDGLEDFESEDKLEDQERDLKYYLNLVELGVDNPDYYEIIAKIYQERNDKELAIKYYSNSIKLRPRNSEVTLNRAILLMEDDPDKAIKELKRVLKIHRTDESDWFRKKAYVPLGELLVKRGITKKELKDLKSACEDWKEAAEFGNEDAAKLLKKHCEQKED